MNQQAPATEMRCPECGELALRARTQNEEFEFDAGDRTVKVLANNVPIKKCDNCGNELSGPDAARIRHNAICCALGLLTPAEIKALRERFGWTQQYLADLAGFGNAIVAKWEQGRLLQNPGTNKVLLAIRDCPEFRRFLEQELTASTQSQQNSLAAS